MFDVKKYDGAIISRKYALARQERSLVEQDYRVSPDKRVDIASESALLLKNSHLHYKSCIKTREKIEEHEGFE